MAVSQSSSPNLINSSEQVPPEAPLVRTKAWDEPVADPIRPERVPLGVVILDKLWNNTVGSLSIDLKRPKPPSASDTQTNLFFINQRQPRQRQQRQPRQQQQYDNYSNAYATFPSFAFDESGGRIKAMRHVTFGHPYEQTKYGKTRSLPSFDIGIGGTFELDTALFNPQARIKFRDYISLKLLPEPAIKFQKRYQLGTSGYGVRVSYECPLEYVDKFWQPPARLLVHLDNTVDWGIRVTQGGLEFDGNTFLLGDAVRVRASGVLSLPNQLPLEEGQQLVQFKAKRLGIKARW